MSMSPQQDAISFLILHGGSLTAQYMPLLEPEGEYEVTVSYPGDATTVEGYAGVSDPDFNIACAKAFYNATAIALSIEGAPTAPDDDTAYTYILAGQDVTLPTVPSDD